jgi:hypothetical protein
MHPSRKSLNRHWIFEMRIKLALMMVMELDGDRCQIRLSYLNIPANYMTSLRSALCLVLLISWIVYVIPIGRFL